jgi:hypothetical protein
MHWRVHSHSAGLSLPRYQQLRGAFNHIAAIDVVYQHPTPDDASVRVHVTPRKCLEPNTVHSLRVCAHAIQSHAGTLFADVHHQFTTIPLPNKRLIVEHPESHIKVHTLSCTALHCTATHSLSTCLQKVIATTIAIGVVGEITAKIACRFALDPRSIAIPIQDDAHFVEWPESQPVRFKVLPDVDLSQPHAYVHHDTPTVDWETYRKMHWVNQRAGFYVLEGKMSFEEETDRLLQIVQAFCDEADRDQALLGNTTAAD